MVKTKPNGGQDKMAAIYMFLNEQSSILIKSLLQIVLNDQTNKKPALVKIMVWHQRSTSIVIQAIFLKFKIWPSWHHDGSQLSTLFSAQWRQLKASWLHHYQELSSCQLCPH